MIHRPSAGVPVPNPWALDPLKKPQQTVGYACVFFEHQSLKALAHLIRQNRSTQVPIFQQIIRKIEQNRQLNRLPDFQCAFHVFGVQILLCFTRLEALKRVIPATTAASSMNTDPVRKGHATPIFP